MTQKVIFADIDTQFDFMKRKGNLYVSGAEKIIPRLKKLTRYAHTKNIPIFASVDAHAQRDPEFQQFPGHCVSGSRGQKKIKETLLRKRFIVKRKKYSKRFLKQILHRYPQIIIEKNTFTVFSNPNTASLFRLADTVYVYGVATDYCVKACCEGLLKLKREVYLITDAIAAVSTRQGQSVLRQLKARGVKLMTTKRACSV
ncbi:cysteine hydrolase family protein [Candidatus Omnitrophota bacterium]